MSEVVLSEAHEALVKSIEEMSVLELTTLVKALEDRLGVSAAAPVAVAAAGGAAVVGLADTGTPIGTGPGRSGAAGRASGRRTVGRCDR